MMYDYMTIYSRCSVSRVWNLNEVGLHVIVHFYLKTVHLHGVKKRLIALVILEQLDLNYIGADN